MFSNLAEKILNLSFRFPYRVLVDFGWGGARCDAFAGFGRFRRSSDRRLSGAVRIGRVGKAGGTHDIVNRSLDLKIFRSLGRPALERTAPVIDTTGPTRIVFGRLSHSSPVKNGRFTGPADPSERPAG